MQRRHRTLMLGSLVMIAWGAVACERTPALEELPAGTDVTVQMEDGRLVTGKLVSVDPEQVVLDATGTDRKIRVTRANVAQVRQTEEAGTRAPALREVSLPAGSRIEATLDSGVASDTSRVEEPVRATLTSPLAAEGVTIAPAGSVLTGVVTSAVESGRVRGRAELALRFDRLQTEAVTYDIRTAPLRWVAEATKGEDAAKIGIGAAAGAVIGGIAGGGKGAAIGSAVGAGGGSAVVLSTRGEEIRLGAGTTLRVELTEDLTVTAPAADSD